MPIWNSTPRTWAVGEKITAALLNAQLRDPLAALGGQWNSYTPQVDQGATTNIAKTVTYARYIQFGKLVIYQANMSFTGPGTAGQPITMTVPIAAASLPFVGSGGIYDSGYGYRNALAFLVTSSKVALLRTDADSVMGYGLGQDPSFALASGDAIYLNAVYEAA